MQKITEQQILAMAPNANAVANGKKISKAGGFVHLERSGDDTFYMGECAGSGKKHYITSVDFLDPVSPVVRCSCPSRQFPCKHGLGLLYDILSGKSFAECEIPEDIIKKRQKKKRSNADGNGGSGKNCENSRDGENSGNGVESAGAAAGDEKKGDAKTAKKTASRASKAARTKKLKKQLEGLELASQLMAELLGNGLGAMGGAALSSYRQLSKQLGDYYLPGPQRLLNEFILEMDAFQKDGSDAHYETAIEVLERLRALIKKACKYLAAKLESGQVEQDDNFLYEELGGVWKLSELKDLGLGREDVSLIQLAFWVTYDEAGKEYIDTGCWADLETGEISLTLNYRPVRALKYIKREDSVFGVAQIPCAVWYPGEGNRRVRWDGAKLRPETPEDFEKLKCFAAPVLAPAVKRAKNLLKNPLSHPMVFGLFSFKRIGKALAGLALVDQEDNTVLLGVMPGMEDTLQRISLLPEVSWLEQKLLLGGLFYSKEAGRILLQPISIISDQGILRLLY